MPGVRGENRASGRNSVKADSVGDAAVHLSQVLSERLSLDDSGGGSGGGASAAVSSSVENQVDHIAVFGSTDGGSGFLLDAVLSLTMAEATCRDPYKSEIETIPTQFKSVSHYKQVQSDFLIEEVSARVHLGIMRIPKKEVYHVLAVLDIDSSPLLFLDIDVTRLSRQGFNHSPKDGDVFLLTMLSPTDVKFDNSCFLGISMEVGPDNSFQKGFRILVSKDHDRCLVKRVKFATFLTNIAEELTISRSISFADFDAINLIIEKSESSTCCSGTKQLIKSDRYNRDQVQCLTNILSKLSCEHEKTIQLVWGSRGTGKTLLTCALVNSLINSGSRVLVCLPTEDSISILLNKLKHEFPEFDFSNLIVLSGSNDTFSGTSMQNRCHELYCAVHLWKSFVKEMAWILGLEIYMPKVQPAGQHTSGNNMIIEFSFDSFKIKFSMVLEQVKCCSNALISSLSGKGLSDQGISKVNRVISTLSRFQELMWNDATLASHVQIAFGIPETRPCPSNSSNTVCKIAYELNDTRICCIELIKDLLGAVMVPKLDGRKDLEQLCIDHSRIVLCTPNYSSQLYNMRIKPDVMIVDDAAHIRESALLVPLSTTPRHIVLIGDHLHIQPMVESKVCKEAGYGISLFERLINLSFDKKILREQYVMNPVLSKLHGTLFYENGILDGLDVLNNHIDFLKDYRFGSYCFLDISDVEELRSDGSSFVESSLIMMLLEDMCKGLTNSKESISVGIVCLCRMRAHVLEDELCVQYEGHKSICLEVISIEKLHKGYDIVILSSVCKDPSLLLEGNRLNVFLSSSRHCIWIIGEAGMLLSSKGALNKLVQQTPVIRIHGGTISQAMQQLKRNMKDCPVNANASCQNNSSHKTGQEYTWKGRPYRTKNIMPPVRDQKKDRDTCSLNTVLEVFESSKKVQYADFDPPKNFEFSMSLPHLKELYEELLDSPFLETDKSERGKRRLEKEMDLLKKHGVKGFNKIESKEGIFKISHYEKLTLKENRVQFSDIKNHLRSGRMLACHFRLSTNYFYLKPGECYEFDETKAYIHPISDMPASHAVMGTGFGVLPSVSRGKQLAHVTMQNSEGLRFGYDGSGTVMRQSLRGAYTMCPEEDMCITTNKQSTSGAQQKE